MTIYICTYVYVQKISTKNEYGTNNVQSRECVQDKPKTTTGMQINKTIHSRKSQGAKRRYGTHHGTPSQLDRTHPTLLLDILR